MCRPGRAAGDDDLMQAALEGDESAFAELMRRHRGWVCGLMHAMVGNREQAEDLAQEAFCRVYRGRRDYAARGNFLAWLKRIAVNVARDFLRGDRRATFVSLDDLAETPARETGFDPFAALASRMLRQEIRDAVDALPPDQRQALVLHYFGGASIEEVAERMGCPVGTIKSRLHHARRRIREMLTAGQDREQGAKTTTP